MCSISHWSKIDLPVPVERVFVLVGRGAGGSHLQSGFFDAAWLVHLASLLYVIAFLVREQLSLRMLVLFATGLYIAYYYFVPERPLWDAIAWSLVLGAANLMVMVSLLLQRTTYGLSQREQALFKHFHTMNPGEFRKLLKIAQWKTAGQAEILTLENQPCERLYYIVEGAAEVKKGGKVLQVRVGTFIGEVAYFLKRDASATVTLRAGGEYVCWTHGDLTNLERKNPAIRVALHQLLSSDMAAKVAAS